MAVHEFSAVPLTKLRGMFSCVPTKVFPQQTELEYGLPVLIEVATPNVIHYSLISGTADGFTRCSNRLFSERAIFKVACDTAQEAIELCRQHAPRSARAARR